MPVLRLYRERAYVDKLRAYKVYVDSFEVGSIKQGENKELEVRPGPHRIYLAIDWCRSPEIVVDGNGDVELVCRAAASPLTAIFYALLWRKSYIVLRISS